MEAFRTRKDTPVPWNIEQQNKRCKRRNTSAIFRKRREGPDGTTQVPDSVHSALTGFGAVSIGAAGAVGSCVGSVDDRVYTG